MATDGQRKSEVLQRVQVGLAGLAGIVLLIGLANIVVDKANETERPGEAIAANGKPASNASSSPKEPLAELGVTPSADSKAPPQTVPDLLPDPNLRKPMDREPAGAGRP